MTESEILHPQPVVLPFGSHLVMSDGRRGADVLLVRDGGDVTEFMLPNGEWIRLDYPTPCSVVLGPE